MTPLVVPSHGTRARYQRGCRCTPCKAAEARYRANLRQCLARGVEPLGRRTVPACVIWRRVKALEREGFSRAEIARRLGLHSPSLQFDYEHVTIATRLRVEQFWRLSVGKDGKPR